MAAASAARQALPESGLLGPVTVLAQVQPVTEPESARSSQPSANEAKGTRRGPVSSSPREQQPFTNGDVNKLDLKLPTLFIAGDSTAARNNDPDHRGWGAVLVDYFDTSKVNVINRAIAGRSFRTYYGEKHWQEVVDKLKPGDFVVIEFGHNDGGGANSPTGRGDVPGTGEETVDVTRRDGTTETVHTYGWYLRKFIQDARVKGATPIVSSTTVRNIWNNGKVADVYEKLGSEAVAKFFPADHTHTSTDGAIINAETLIAGLKAIPDMPLVSFLNPKGQAIEAYHPAK